MGEAFTMVCSSDSSESNGKVLIVKLSRKNDNPLTTSGFVCDVLQEYNFSFIL